MLKFVCDNAIIVYWHPMDPNKDWLEEAKEYARERAIFFRENCWCWMNDKIIAHYNRYGEDMLDIPE